MALIRLGWFVLAVVSAGFAVQRAREPMLWTNECQLGEFPTPRIRSWNECTESTLSHYGNGLLFALAVPVILCLIPVVVPRRAVAWAVATTLAGMFIALILTELNFLSAHEDSVLWFAGDCLPAALGAVLLASLHNRIGSRSIAKSPAVDRVSQPSRTDG
ncbi:hypothetical protein ACGFIU_09350 [Rhodococcus oryzae]|uniref:hypothetical protein n=1 Tax=Rhodococcus oryzae TaxID=2571143 RepID=UPI00372179C6